MKGIEPAFGNTKPSLVEDLSKNQAISLPLLFGSRLIFALRRSPFKLTGRDYHPISGTE
jgi:hypothetical protein